MKHGFAEEANAPLSAICFIPRGSYLSPFTSHSIPAWLCPLSDGRGEQLGIKVDEDCVSQRKSLQPCIFETSLYPLNPVVVLNKIHPQACFSSRLGTPALVCSTPRGWGGGSPGWGPATPHRLLLGPRGSAGSEPGPSEQHPREAPGALLQPGPGSGCAGPAGSGTPCPEWGVGGSQGRAEGDLWLRGAGGQRDARLAGGSRGRQGCPRPRGGGSARDRPRGAAPRPAAGPGGVRPLPARCGHPPNTLQPSLGAAGAGVRAGGVRCSPGILPGLAGR